jgi:hypothetical protein
MTRAMWLIAGVASLATCAPAATAFAATPVILKEGGVVAPEGSPASGSLELTCAHLAFAGTLKINDEPLDEAVFDEGGGTDLCEGVAVRGAVRAIKVTRMRHFAVLAHLIYETLTSKRCVYVISRLEGTFTIPGLTKSMVSGKGKLTTGSAPGCAETLTITGARAVLSSGTTHEPYFAES